MWIVYVEFDTLEQIADFFSRLRFSIDEAFDLLIVNRPGNRQLVELFVAIWGLALILVIEDKSH